MLLAIRVPLKHFFKNCFGLSNEPENGPKCPFSLFLGIIFGAFAKQYSTEFHNGSWFKRGNGNGNSKAKNDPWKFHIIFSWSP